MGDFIACFRQDVSAGRRFTILSLAFAVWAMLVESGSGADAIVYVAGSDGSFSALSVLGFAFNGVPPMGEGGQFVLPLSWISLMLAIVLPPCLYPSCDFGSRRCSQVLVRTSRSAWWWSKIIWSIASWGTIFGVLLAVSALSGAFFSVDSGIPFGSCDSEICGFVLYAALTTLCFSVCACVCSSVFGCVPATCAAVVLLVASAYSATPLFLANYAMLERISTGSVPLPSWSSACFAVLAVCATVSLAGYLMFMRFDRLK